MIIDVTISEGVVVCDDNDISNSTTVYVRGHRKKDL